MTAAHPAITSQINAGSGTPLVLTNSRIAFVLLGQPVHGVSKFPSPLSNASGSRIALGLVEVKPSNPKIFSTTLFQ